MALSRGRMYFFSFLFFEGSGCLPCLKSPVDGEPRGGKGTKRKTSWAALGITQARNDGGLGRVVAVGVVHG